ncbi:MAG: DUF4041 domain-containing protein [Deltaproteobacteria bacterium]|nr:DUF4041 domain-containing protein [Deltaproteobacteria bacterium]
MTPPGWYPDPHDGRYVRYWDGSQWTEHVKAAVAASGPPGPVESLGPGGAPAATARVLAQLERERAELAAEIMRLREEIELLKSELVETNDLMLLQEVGVYQYAHPLNDAVAYQERLRGLQEQIKDAIRDKRAVSGTTKWAINGSAKDGAKMVADFQKLMLRTYNNEADNIVRTLKPYSLESAIERLQKLRATIKKLGAAMRIDITDTYEALRIQELELTADYAAKVAEERERAREERERLKEEEAARRDFEREQARLEKEKAHYQALVAALVHKRDPEALAAAEAKLVELGHAIEGLIERAANIRAGYVYVISNIGAFGDRVVKIGLTRRLEPMDRVRELGDASVPFRFDVHALIFSDDAVGLETALHQRFAAHRVNLINPRREFFYVRPEAVRDVLRDLRGDLLTFVSAPDAVEWHQSENLRRAGATIVTGAPAFTLDDLSE